MNSNAPLLLLALPLWLASCAPSMDLIGERSIEHDEYYLQYGDAHTGDAALEIARQEMLLDQYDEYMDGDYDNPYGGQVGSGPYTRSQLWNRYTPSWNTGFNSGWGGGFGTPFGYSAYNSPYGFGSPSGFGNSYGFGYGSSGYSPFFQPQGMTTYGWGNQAFMNGYDAWGNPMGWGNPTFGSFGGNGWGYDPWGGGWWGAPSYGYWYNNYHPHYGTLGAYNNGWCGTLAGDGTSDGQTAPRPRPLFTNFTGYGGQAGGSSDGDAGAGSGQGSQGSVGAKPDATRPASNRATNRRSTQRSRNTVTTIPGSPRQDYGRQSPDRSGEQNVQPTRNRSNRSNGRSNNNWSAPSSPRNDYTPPAPRGGSSRPAAPRPSSPRSTPSRGGSRGGRGG
jgi:hypothetical protein